MGDARCPWALGVVTPEKRTNDSEQGKEQERIKSEADLKFDI